MQSTFALLLMLSGIGWAQAAEYPTFKSATLKVGRGIWLGTCEACHASSITGAPQVNKPADWAARIAKGRPALIQSAVQGFIGSSGEEMPPRGGNANLSDAEVTAALEYMLKLVTVKGETK